LGVAEHGPSWLALLAPLPEQALVERKAVASAQQIADGTAGPIAGWQNVTVHLSEPEFGLRHLQITLDADGRLLAGGDHVMVVRRTTPDGITATLTEHESVGGRFDDDGAFRGTHWRTTLESGPDSDDSITKSAESRGPTEREIAALRILIAEILKREARA
jgi:hypothetical protein